MNDPHGNAPLSAGFRDFLVSAIERYEAALTASEAALAIPVGTPDRVDLVRATRGDLSSMEHALAYAIDYAMDDEVDDSSGPGVIHNGVAYALRDSVGNMADGIIARVRVMLSRMAALGEEGGRAGGPGPGPGTGDDPSDRAGLIRRAVSAAVARYHEAQRWAEVAYRLDSRPEAHSNPWAVLAGNQACAARTDLIRTIYALDEGVRESEIDDCERRRWGPRGVHWGGKLYLATPSPDDDRDESKNSLIMRLVIAEVGGITNVDGAMVTGPDEREAKS